MLCYFRYDTYFNTFLTFCVEHGQIPWMNRIRQALLQKEDANVIQVDWYKGAKIPYETAVANARMVGAQVSQYSKNDLQKCIQRCFFSLGVLLSKFRLFLTFHGRTWDAFLCAKLYPTSKKLDCSRMVRFVSRESRGVIS